jgi:hypothetical protein
MRKLKRTLQMMWIVPLLVMALQACHGSIMVTVPKVELPEPGFALVTFIAETRVMGPKQFGLWDGENLIGVVTPKTYIQYKAAPGKHLFLGRAENWTICEADLEAGRNYYIMANAFMGVWKARVAFDPVRKGDANVTDDQIRNWLATFSPLGVDPAQRDNYVASNINDVKTIIIRHNEGKTKYEIMTKDDWR